MLYVIFRSLLSFLLFLLLFILTLFVSCFCSHVIFTLSCFLSSLVVILIPFLCDPFVFLENLSKYDKDTPICTDHSLNCEIDGFDVARRLHEAGFSRLFLLSGWEDIKEAPSYLTVVSKPDVVNLKNVL